SVCCGKTHRRSQAEAWTAASGAGALVLAPHRAACSALGDGNLKIFAGKQHGAIVGAVHAADQRQQIVAEPLLSCRVEGGESLEHGAIVAAEDVEEVLGRAIAKHEMARLGLDRGRLAKQFVKAGARAPKRRRLGTGGWRQVLAQGREELADEA